jgi:hypothetical protein
MSAHSADVAVLRDLAKRYAEAAAKPVHDERRDLWRRHNALESTRALIYVRWFACRNEIIEPNLVCTDPFYRRFERQLREFLFQDAIGDDFILEPWIRLPATHVLPDDGRWGVPVRHVPTTEKGGSWMFDPPLKEPEDLEKLVTPRHEIDEDATQQDAERLGEAIGDIIQVCVDRRPAWFMWTADISTELAQLRGLEQMMWDMVDNPEWLHRLLAFLRDGVLAAHEQAEQAGDWRLCDQENQAMPYAKELDDPGADPTPVKRKQLWTFCASQETTEVSPAMFDEFMLSYQIPIIEKFALSAYGCCEDLTHKIDRLRRISNLRRIAVTPWADLRSCAEQIGRDYVISWRPSPAEQVCSGFDPEHVEKTVRTALETAAGCHVDITLKDVETVQGRPERLVEWTKIVRRVIDREHDRRA